MNQNLCPHTLALIDQTVQTSRQRGPLYLFDQEDLRQELILYVLEAQKKYTGPVAKWTDHCRTVLARALRTIRANHSPSRPENQNLPLDSLTERDIPLDDTLLRIIGRMQKSKNRCKSYHMGCAILQTAQDARVAELIAQLPAHDQIFAVFLAALSKKEILQETGLSENAYSDRLHRVADTLKTQFPQLAKGRQHRKTNPNHQNVQEKPSEQPKTINPEPATPQQANQETKSPNPQQANQKTKPPMPEQANQEPKPPMPEQANDRNDHPQTKPEAPFVPSNMSPRTRRSSAPTNEPVYRTKQPPSPQPQTALLQTAPGPLFPAQTRHPQPTGLLPKVAAFFARILRR